MTIIDLTQNTKENKTSVRCENCFNFWCVKCENNSDVCTCSNKDDKYTAGNLNLSNDEIRQIIGHIIDRIVIHKCPVVI